MAQGRDTGRIWVFLAEIIPLFGQKSLTKNTSENNRIV
jgi:hypothetical protein